MERKQLIGMLGAGMLFGGVFAPTIALGLPGRLSLVPLSVGISYFQYSRAAGFGEWMVLISMAGAALLLALSKIYLGLLFTGVISLGMPVLTAINLQQNTRSLLDLLPPGIVAALSQLLDVAGALLVQPEWGIVLLIGGPLLMLAAAVLPEDRQTRARRTLQRTAQTSVECDLCRTANPASHTFCCSCGARLLPAATLPAGSPPSQGPAALLTGPARRPPPHG